MNIDDFAKQFEADGKPLQVEIEGVKIWGLYPYCSIFATRMSKNPALTTYLNRVINFKTRGANGSEIFAAINAFKDEHGAELVAAVPSHDGKPNRMQEKYGVIIRRTIEVETRKYNHQNGIDEKGIVIDKESISGKSVLLLDDIATTGRSMLEFRAMLLRDGASEVTCLCVGMNINLILLEEKYKQEQREQEEAQKRNEAGEPAGENEAPIAPEEITVEDCLEDCGENHIPLDQAFAICEITEQEFSENIEWQKRYRKGQLRTDFEVQQSVIKMAKNGDQQAIRLYYERLRQDILPDFNGIEDEEEVEENEELS